MNRGPTPMRANGLDSLGAEYRLRPVALLPRGTKVLPRRTAGGLFFAELLITGYLAFGNSFAHLGIAPLYPAELFLAASLLFGGAVWLQLYFRELGNGNPIAVTATAFFAWGLIQVFRGFLGGFGLLASFRGLATHYYVFLFFIGWQLASRVDSQWFLSRLKWVSAIVIAAGIFVAAVTIFTQPAMPSFTAIALLAFAPYLGAWFYPLFTGNIAVLLLHAGRASWLSAIAGVALVVRSAGQTIIRRMVYVCACLAILISLVGPMLPAAQGRGGNLSARWLIARMMTLVDTGAAEQMIADNGNASDISEIRSISGTKEWRKRFWQATLDSLDSQDLWLIGNGYGFSLGTLIHEDVHTPHNFAIYLLGYTGCIGLALYTGLLLALARGMWVLRRGPFRSFLLAQLPATLILASFGNGLETPSIAVPFYLVMGIAYGLAGPSATLIGSTVTVLRS